MATSWATITPGLNTARGSLAGLGTQTAGLAFGGEIVQYRSNGRI
jgi:hypothetical protein